MPVRGGATIRQRWPLPIGATRSMTRADLSLALIGVERREVVEVNLVAGLFRLLEVQRVDLDHREVPFAFLRRADEPFDRVAGAQRELADQRGADIDVVGAGQVVRLGRAQEPESVLQDLQNSAADDFDVPVGKFLEDREDQLLPAHGGCAFDLQLFREGKQSGRSLLLELGELEFLNVHVKPV